MTFKPELDRGIDLTVDLGKGDDQSDVRNVFGDVVKFDLGAGSNTLNLDNMNALRLTILGGNETDQVTANLLTITKLKVDLNNGVNGFVANDIDVERLDYVGGTGADTLEVNASLVDNLDASMGNSADAVRLANVNIPVSLDLDGGKDQDTLINPPGNTRPQAKKNKIKNFEL
jgi:hypothetical protein